VQFKHANTINIIVTDAPSIRLTFPS